MRRRITSQRDNDSTLALNAVFPTLCMYGMLLWFIHFWILVVDNFSEFKAFVFEPWLGPFHLAHILTFMNVAWVLLLAGQATLLWKRRSHPTRRSLVALASALILVIAIQFWVRGLNTIATRYDNDRIRSDQEMVTHFEEQRKHFEMIVSGLGIDLETREDDGPFFLWEASMNSDVRPFRWYWHHQNKIGIRRDITGSHRGSRVVFVTAVNAIGSHGSFKGYLYAEQAPAPLVDNLDALESSPGVVKSYRRIGDNWYLFLDKKP